MEASYKAFEEMLEKANENSFSVAKQTGINPSALSDWKSGRCTPKADKILKLAEFFGVPMEEFYR